MTTNNYVCLVLQLLCILGFMVLVMLLVIIITKARYTAHYAFMRKVFHNDNEPYLWRKANPIYNIMRMMCFGAIVVTLRLSEQIRTDEYLVKSWLGTLGSILFIYAVVKMVRIRITELTKEKENGTA